MKNLLSICLCLLTLSSFAGDDEKSDHKSADKKVETKTISKMDLFEAWIDETSEPVLKPDPETNILRFSSDIKWIDLLDENGIHLVTINQSVLDLSKYPNGDFTVELTDSHGEIFTKKVVKE